MPRWYRLRIFKKTAANENEGVIQKYMTKNEIETNQGTLNRAIE